MKVRYGIKTKFGGSSSYPKDIYDEYVRQRLKSKIEIKNGCWEWCGCITKLGYGHTSYRSKTLPAHRISYMVFHGDIPPGINVCHKCHNRRCINPDHLILGTQSENMKSCFLESRKSHKGENHPGAKLEEKDIHDIFYLSKSGMTQTKIAERYGVYQGTISAILKRRLWSHIKN